MSDPDHEMDATPENPPTARLTQWKSSLAGRTDGIRALVWALLLNLVLFGAFLAIATPMYDTNDDLALQQIASGFYTGTPDAHLLFTNILIGWLLKFLYALAPSWNWYFGYLISVHFAAMTAIAFLVISRRGGYFFTGAYFAFFLVVEVRILLHLQFTTTAFIAGTASILLVADGLQRQRPISWLRVITGILFFGVMCLIREQIALLWGVLIIPFLLERVGFTEWRRLLGLALVCAGALGALHGINYLAYQQDSAWADFYQYNRLRGEIHDTPLAHFMPAASPTVGWSENDGWMFSQFYFPDAATYGGVPKMEHLLNELRTLRAADHAKPGPSITQALLLPDMYANNSGLDSGCLMNLAMFVAISCIVAAGGARRRVTVVLLIYYALIWAISFYLLSTIRLPERVAYCFPLFIQAICLYWATGFGVPDAEETDGTQKSDVDGSAHCEASGSSARRAKAVRLAPFVVLSILAIYYLPNVAILAGSLKSANAANGNLKGLSRGIFEPIRDQLPTDRTPLLIPLPADSLLEQTLFFHPSTANVPFEMVPYGCITQSPLFTEILDHHQLNPYSLSVLHRPDTYFMMQPRWIVPLETFYLEHYGLHVRFDTVLDTDTTPRFAKYHIHLYRAHIEA